jgi:cell division protease FtsH
MTPSKPPMRANRDSGNSAPTWRRVPSDKRDGATKPFGQMNMPPRRAWLTFAIILLLNYLLMSVLFPSPDTSITIPYTTFKEEAEKGNVKSIYSMGPSIEGRFVKPVTWPLPAEAKTAPAPDEAKPPAAPGEAKSAPGEAKPAPAPGQAKPATAPSGNATGFQGMLARLTPKAEPRTSEMFTTTLPAFVDQGLESFLIKHNVEISAVPIKQGGGTLATLLYGFGPAILIIAFYVWMFRRAQQGGVGGSLMGIGKSKARRYDQESQEKVTFDDVAGIDEAENELVEIVDFLKSPEKYTRLGGSAPKGVLLVGAPGTGKTLLAKAVAGEAGVPFFSMSAAEFVEMIVGVGAARVRDLFKQARENAPAIIFIDEIDSIGRARGTVAIGGASEQEQTLNQILTEMDGFTGREGVIVLAATNQPDVLDKALLRPGRFDRRVVVNLPDKVGREAILKVHTRKVPLARDADLAELAATTPGLSGADLKNLVNEAALLAARRDQKDVHQKDFMDALEKIVLGPERPLLLSHEDRERIAYHESGHAILGLVVPGADPVHRVTIVPRGQALGVTYQRPQTDRYNYPEAYLRAKIVGMLGGRAAEEIVYGTKTTGAESDIEQATNIARNMVTRWGMSDKLGMVQLAPRQNDYVGGGLLPAAKPFSEETARIIDAEVQRIIDECHAEGRRLLTLHRKELDALVAALLKRETLGEQEILEVTGLPRAPELSGEPLTEDAARERIKEMQDER